MQSKSLLIAIAAFAVTATGVHAYGGAEILAKAGLNDDKIEALEQARELRANGNLTAARDKIIEAGITEEELLAIREAKKAARLNNNQALMEGDYRSFRAAVADSPLADIVTSEADFEQFKEAHNLKKAEELGSGENGPFLLGANGAEKKRSHTSAYGIFSTELTDTQREALMVAQRANDKSAVQAILDEAGLGSLLHGSLKNK